MIYAISLLIFVNSSLHLYFFIGKHIKSFCLTARLIRSQNAQNHLEKVVERINIINFEKNFGNRQSSSRGVNNR